MTLALVSCVVALSAVALTILYARQANEMAELKASFLIVSAEAKRLDQVEDDLLEAHNKQVDYIAELEKAYVDTFDNSSDAAVAFTKLLQNHPD